MQFSYNWLKTQADTRLSADELAHLLTMAGLEVEATQSAAPAFSGVVIAEVTAVTKHPDADRLHITQVDAGTGGLIQIVCGAPNVKAGIKVACALPGAVLAGNLVIKSTKMRGQASDGMLCSAKELGLSEQADGLLVLSENAPIGVNIRDFLDLDDTLFTLKITPNRADCLSIKGLAREVAALTQCAVTFPAIHPTPIHSSKTQAVRIDAPDDCGRFLSRVIEQVNAQADSPHWLKQRLERSGIRSISALVDIGNYVMLELGQPMHVFDADKLNGSLIIRRAEHGETLACLNEKNVVLSNNTLVVADEKGVLSLAGIMGGTASAVSDSTQNIVLEAAWFTPEIIAGKSRQYGFGSDSSFRFERGVDFELQRHAIERASELILQICGGSAGNIVEASGKLPERQTVAIRPTRVEKILGTAIDKTRIATILTTLGLQPKKVADSYQIIPPSFRYDIEIEVDLIEEIARVYGYNNITADNPSGRLAMQALPENSRNRFTVYQQMAERGYQEVVNYAFVDEQWEQDFAANNHPIRLQNPLAEQYSVMRSTLIGSLVEVLQNNLNRKQNRIRVFEIARVFHKNSDSLFTQKERVGGLIYGSVTPEQWAEKNRTADFYDAKGDVENLLAGKNITFTKTLHPALHPGRAADIVTNGQVIGFMGELHPKWLHKYDLPQTALVFEIDMDAVLNKEKTTYRPVSKFQAVRRDLAFVVPENMPHDDLLNALRSVQNKLIQEISVFDVYRGVGLPENMKSIAVKVILQDTETTLTDEVVASVIEKLVKSAEQVGASLRH